MDNAEVERLLALTGKFYDAALDARLWPDVLEDVCGYVGGCAANLFSHDTESRRPTAYFQWGNDPQSERAYIEKYYRLNPLMPAMNMFEAGEVHSQADIVPYDAFYATRFYEEWVKPQGVIDAVAATLEKTDSRSAMMAIRRAERHGRVDAEARRRMELLVPHARRAVAIGQVIEFHEGVSSALTGALDAIRSGVVLVDRIGRIVFSNGSADDMLGLGTVIRRDHDILTATDPAGARVLAEVFASAPDGDAAVGVKGAAVALSDAGGERWVAHVLPLTSGARRSAGAPQAATAAVFVRRAGIAAPSHMAAAARLHGLTPAEMRVVAALVDVGGVPAVAGALGLSRATVRTHLKSVFEKTRVNRQADLVKLVASMGDGLGA